jgi:hypothetical protein
MASKNANLRAKREKVKAQGIMYAQFVSHQNDYQMIHGVKRVDTSDMIATWLATHKVKKCRAGKDTLRTFAKGAGVTLGDASPGRSCHVAGYRHVYSR